jgi:hypothetical protein
MLISAILWLFVLLRVDELATEDPGVQQELVESKLCPWPLNFLGSTCYCFMWFFGYGDTHYSWSYFYYQLLFTVHDKIILLIGTWRTTRENSATTRVVWDTIGWLIRKASGWLPYPKGARAVGEWSVEGGPWVDFVAMAVRRGIPALDLPKNCSGFSEASGTL